MKICSKCKKEMKELVSKTPEGIEYTYFKCSKCGEEILDMKQLHNVSQKYRELKRFNAKLSNWGSSLGLRIPKELTVKYHLSNNTNITLIPDDEGIRIVI